MSEYRLADVKPTSRLRDAYGEEIELTEDDRDTAVIYKIALEFDVRGRSYAVLRAEETSGDDEIMLYRVKHVGEGEYEIETIEDDDEWEDISELVDEMTTRFTDEA